MKRETIHDLIHYLTAMLEEEKEDKIEETIIEPKDSEKEITSSLCSLPLILLTLKGLAIQVRSILPDTIERSIILSHLGEADMNLRAIQDQKKES